MTACRGVRVSRCVQNARTDTAHRQRDRAAAGSPPTAQRVETGEPQRRAPGSWLVVVLSALVTSLLPTGAARAAADAEPEPGAGRSAKPLPEVVVVGIAPLGDSGIDIDKMPGRVQTLSSEAIDRDGLSATVAQAAARRMTGVVLSNELGSPYQPEFVFRGLKASPVQGAAQGLAVYQDGMPLNEAFTGVVNWDLIPQCAMRRLTLQSDTPLFGPSALGGVVTIDMKNAFTAPGARAELTAGSFGHVGGCAEYGQRAGPWGGYVAASALTDDGYRFETSARSTRTSATRSSGPTLT